jgi:hypothetical protein
MEPSQLCSHSRTSQHIMEPEGSLPCSQLVSILSHINPIHTIPSLQQLKTTTFNSIRVRQAVKWAVLKMLHQTPKTLAVHDNRTFFKRPLQAGLGQEQINVYRYHFVSTRRWTIFGCLISSFMATVLRPLGLKIRAVVCRGVSSYRIRYHNFYQLRYMQNHSFKNLSPAVNLFSLRSKFEAKRCRSEGSVEFIYAQLVPSEAYSALDHPVCGEAMLVGREHLTVARLYTYSDWSM